MESQQRQSGEAILGIIAGLVVNGARILELAAAKDGRVTTRGDVQLLPPGSLLDRAAPLQRMQQVIRLAKVSYVTVANQIQENPGRIRTTIYLAESSVC